MLTDLDVFEEAYALCMNLEDPQQIPSRDSMVRIGSQDGNLKLSTRETAADENSTSYFPLLDRIADGYFSKSSTDKELYEKFLEILKEDGHMPDTESLSSYQFALSMRSAAPRIEAHYQYYYTAAEPSLAGARTESCPSWVLLNNKQYCSPALDTANADIEGNQQVQELQFDRIIGNISAPASILYADITSPTFGHYHKTLVKTAREGKTSYRIRHKKALSQNSDSHIFPGYGVELALKRTDYIVIDDREGEQETVEIDSEKKEVKFEDEEFADLKPLSSSELLGLGLKASSFILESEKPFDTLVKLSQDFPKYSSAIASHNPTKEFVAEHEYNRAQLVPAGYNVWWMNGIQMDKRYEDWPTSLQALLQRTYPGQLPTVRRDCFNLVLLVDFTSPEDVHLIVEQLRGFVQRKLNIRIGLVPIVQSVHSLEQARVVYYLVDSYGLSTAILYLEKSLAAGKLSAPSKSVFEAAIEGRNPKPEKVTRAAIQTAIFQDFFEHDSWVPSLFMASAAKRRNSLIVPEDEKNLKIFDVNELLVDNQDLFHVMPHIDVGTESAKEDWAHMTVVADLESEGGVKLLATAAIFREANPSIELAIMHNPSDGIVDTGFSYDLFARMEEQPAKIQTVNGITDMLSSEKSVEVEPIEQAAKAYWHQAAPFIKSLNLLAGENAILLNGRLVGPIPSSVDISNEDMIQLLSYEKSKRGVPVYSSMEALGLAEKISSPQDAAKVISMVAISTISDTPDGMFEQASTRAVSEMDSDTENTFRTRRGELPVKRFYRYVIDSKPSFNEDGSLKALKASFTGVPQEALLTLKMDVPPAWLVAPKVSIHDLDNIKLSSVKSDVEALYELEHILIEGHSREVPGGAAPRGAQLVLGTERDPHFADTIIMANLGYFQFKANPGYYKIKLQEGRSEEIFNIDSIGAKGWSPAPGDENSEVVLMSFQGTTLYPRLSRKPGMGDEDVLESKTDSPMDFVSRGLNFAQGILGKGKSIETKTSENAEINIFSVASGHLYERMLNIMMVSVMKHTKHTVKFWFIEQFLSPSFKDFIPYMAEEYGFQYEMVTFKWPHWLRGQTEKQREIWGYKILFLDVLFPLSLDKVIFVDADQIVRTDMIELVNHDLKGAPYGFTPMCDSRTEMEGFRFWKQGYWKNFLRGLPYHISALYVVDLHKFRQIAAGDRLRQQYHQLSADPASLSNLDQDLPNHMQAMLPIHSLPQEWLWCETWCSDEALKEAKTIDLCNNPLTKEPKLERARRQVPEWTVYDDEIAAVDRKRKGLPVEGKNEKSRTMEVMIETPETKKKGDKDEL
ncbi:putative UDP-glucose:glycoprotein glucosyltransferase [Glarea lozoyensis 74030]|uniref:Putative UDP-glucose:glycoprotein glucosyltransferase n=1 Tax=Glarea lozoyensis (strain ATCC 74030 / MF5533) TaxID=1104152 RepID=H0EUL9_GLAL7|nr:putative UDP-glucose:glycoprotein glucosyltransferase [Glarea lozoyensis 74030]